MLESGELADVVLVCAGDLEVQGHGVVLLSVPYLCAAIRELRHKRVDDSELMTVNLPDCEQEAVRSALRFTYSGESACPVFARGLVCVGRHASFFGVLPRQQGSPNQKECRAGIYDTPPTVKGALDLLRCAAKLQLVPLMRACSRTLEMMLAPECVAEVWEASHLYQLDRLKTKCLRFIIDNYGSRSSAPPLIMSPAPLYTQKDLSSRARPPPQPRCCTRGAHSRSLEGLARKDRCRSRLYL